MEKSEYSIINDHGRTTVVYTNVYMIDGNIYYNSDQEDLPIVQTFGDREQWSPTVKTINDHSFNTIDLACFSTFIWIHNIGHALFDCLYPIYVSMVRAGCHKDDFYPISNDVDGKGTMGYNCIEQFCGKKFIHLKQNKDYIRIKKLVCGTLGVGNVFMSPNPVMYGQNEYGSMTLFRERMMRRYSIQDNYSERIKAIVIQNKRYSNKEVDVIKQCIDLMSQEIDIKYIDWSADYLSFEGQLQEIAGCDIHITGPGTGMMYMPFLKPGSVNINLGFMEHTQTNWSRPNIRIENAKKDDYKFPSYMEQYVCSTADYVSTIYYDRYRYNDILLQPLKNIIDIAVLMVKKKSASKKNHYIDMSVFVEYCRRSESSEKVCKHLTDIAFFPEMFVNEHPYAINKDFVDIQLLRQIKDELGYNRSYEVI